MNSKWEAVDPIALKARDKVRLRHDNGDIIHGTLINTISSDQLRVDAQIDAPLILDYWIKRGYRFERAVPERTLPTEDGIYVSAEDYALNDFHLYARNGGEWQDDTREAWLPSDEALIPFDLVRLVPVTEAEELRKRIEQADAFIASRTNYYLDSTDIKEIRRYLVGEATDV